MKNIRYIYNSICTYLIKQEIIMLQKIHPFQIPFLKLFAIWLSQTSNHITQALFRLSEILKNALYSLRILFDIPYI